MIDHLTDSLRMRLPRILAPVLLVTALVTAACGGGGSSPGTSSGAPASVGGSPSGSGTSASTPKAGSDQEFCTAYANLVRALATAVSVKDGASKLKDVADRLESSAPTEIKGDAKNVADAYRGIADSIQKDGNGQPKFDADTTKSIANIAVWMASHCS